MFGCDLNILTNIGTSAHSIPLLLYVMELNGHIANFDACIPLRLFSSRPNLQPILLNIIKVTTLTIADLICLNGFFRKIIKLERLCYLFYR